jgi:hypothetical protein
MPFRPLASRIYKLDGHRVVACADLLEWAQWFETAERHVAEDAVEGYRVSTVFLGLDHDWQGSGPPVVFESMIFSPDGEAEAMDRYRTWEEAEAGHARMLQGLREELHEALGRADLVLAELVQRLRAT